MAAASPFAVVLGTAQDAGFPSAGCRRQCCAEARRDPDLRRFAASLAIVDPESHERWLIDCTPDFREELDLLDELAPGMEDSGHGAGLAGILLTHAHIGHYLGLAQLGREGLDACGMPVWAMPRMAAFLRNNEPWRQLVNLGQIEPRPLAGGTDVWLNQRLSVRSVAVPHRGEFSETVGFLVSGPRRRLFYLPDIDGWDGWQDEIMGMVELADVLCLDGTFFNGAELPGRDLAEIPHPTIETSLEFFAALPAERRSRIRFIHFNHTNPVLADSSSEAQLVRRLGFGLAGQGDVIEL